MNSELPGSLYLHVFMRKAFIPVLFLFASITSFAQYNDSTHYYTGIASAGTINKTATSNSYVLSNMIKLGVRKKELGLNFSNNWLYGEQQKKLTNNDFTSTFDCNIYKTWPHFYYWALANYTTSYSLKINNQYQGGVGIAYNIVDTKTEYLNISDGILYESSDINLKDTIRSVYSTYRNSLRISFKFTIKEIFVVSGTNFIQSSLSDENDYILKSNLSMGFKIKKWLNIATTFSYNRFNRTQKENTLFTYGISIDQYF